jgi:hypothetical protein
MLFDDPVPAVPWLVPEGVPPACAVTVTDEPGKDVAVLVPPEPIVKLIVPETARAVSSAYSPPPPPPPAWELPPARPAAPLPPSPQACVSAVVTPPGVDHDPLDEKVTVVTECHHPGTHWLI